MPELPEVETVCRVLSKNIVGLTIKKVKVLNKNLRYTLHTSIEKKILQSKIKSIIRRGKYGLILLNNKNLIIFHLGMTGKFVINFKIYEKTKHDHLVIEFNNNLKIIYNDVRKFGYIKLSEKPIDICNLNNLGYEPSIAIYFKDILFVKAKRRKAAIKDILLDQSFICGVGNIYASEILFKAKISPFKKGIYFNKNEFAILLNALKYIIDKAIEKGGSTIKDYTSPQDELGYFQTQFQVYNREGLPCYYCKSLITRIKQSGRSTFYCIKCQRKLE